MPTERCRITGASSAVRVLAITPTVTLALATHSTSSRHALQMSSALRTSPLSAMTRRLHSCNASGSK